MQPDGNYYRNDLHDEDMDESRSPNSDAATAIVSMNCEPPDGLAPVLRNGDVEQELLHQHYSSLHRHPGHPGPGKRVLFVGGIGMPSSSASGHHLHRDLDSGEEGDDWSHPMQHWSTPLVAAAHQVPRVDSSMDTNRTVRGGSVCTDWTDSRTGTVTGTPHSPGLIGQQHNFHVGIYGWRKRCLYLLILALLVMVIVNLALTLWVLKVMEFSSEGMGQLRVVSGGLQLSGQAVVLDSLIASSIRSRKGQPITLESSRNFSLNIRDEEGRLASQLFLGSERLECAAAAFRVSDNKGRTLFSADKKEVVVGASLLRVTGEGGAVFDSSIQTPAVRADSGSDLRLESPTRSLEVRAPQGVAIESRAGDISASCLTDLTLKSAAGSIRVDSSRIFLQGLKMDVGDGRGRGRASAAAGSVPAGGGGSPGGPGSASGSAPRAGRRRDDIYQLCMCGNGKLFLSAAEGLCAADDDSLVCR